MCEPPVNLLLPRPYSFQSHFAHYPLHIHSESVTPVLSCLLNYQLADELQEKAQESGSLTNIWLICSSSREEVSDAFVSDRAPFRNFFTSDATAKGKYLWAARRIQMIYVSTLQELRTILVSLLHETSVYGSQKPANTTIASQNPDVSLDHHRNAAGRSVAQPLLVISGLDTLHRSAGELSGQGLSRTLSNALDATALGYKLVFHTTEPLELEIAVLNTNALAMPGFADVPRTTMRRIVQQFAGNNWTVPPCAQHNQGLWKFLDYTREHKNDYLLTWNENVDGESVDIVIST